MSQLVTIREAARVLNVSPTFLYANIKALPHFRLSARAVRFDLQELRDWFRARATERRREIVL